MVAAKAAGPAASAPGASRAVARASLLPAAPHVRDVADLCAHFEVDPDRGLSAAAVEVLQARFGFNELEQPQPPSILALLLEQFKDLLARILLAAAFISFVLALVSGEEDEGWSTFVEPSVILIILAANAAVSVWQETSAEKSLEALKRLQPDLAQALRDGVWATIPARELVPGDVVAVAVGDRIPADMRVLRLKTASLRVEQSQLTGETHSVPKEAKALAPELAAAEIQTHTNMVFAGTTVAHGGGTAIVTATGMLTQIGRIQEAVQRAGEEAEQTPLQKKLEEFGEALSKVIGVICLMVWLINFRNFSEPSHGGFVRGCIYYFKTAVALAVAAIPEGLTAVITTCLALGTRNMAQQNAIVRHLPSVETLGCTTVICSDKTGTLTTNQMSCVRFAVVSGEPLDKPAPRAPDSTAARSLDKSSDAALASYVVTGHTYSRVGAIKTVGTGRPLRHVPGDNVTLQYFARIAAACNQSKLEYVKDRESEQHALFERTQSGVEAASARLVRQPSYLSRMHPDSIACNGEPTEGALKVLVEQLGCPDEVFNRSNHQLARGSDGPEAFCHYWLRDVSVLAILELSRDRKSMSVLCRRRGANSNELYVKGAPESVVARCTTLLLPDGRRAPMTEASRRAILAEVDTIASEALRPLALAVRFEPGALADYSGPEHPAHAELANPDTFAAIESDLAFCGLVGIVDPPRPEVAGAIQKCRAAGIKVIMITGDNKKTAEAVALKVGIIEQEPGSSLSPAALSKSLQHLSYTGKEFEILPHEEKIRILSNPQGAIFSRTEPKHKQLIVKIFRELGEITAMTGDGVNDAPALKQADIGIAMGIAGTEVAKGAADMVLADDNFNSIVLAVEQGRSIYNNMKAFIRYLISSNIGEVASIFFTAALGIPEGLAPVQLLWVNLVTDGFPATALGFNPPDRDVMTKAPRRRDDPLISSWVFLRYLIVGLYVGFATVGVFVWWYLYGFDPNDGHTLISFHQLTNWAKCHSWNGTFQPNQVYNMVPDDPCSYFYGGKAKASTLSLTVLVVIEMFNALNALSEEGSLLQIPPWANPWLLFAIAGSVSVHLAILYTRVGNSIFGVVPLSLHDWWWVLIWSFPVLLIDEALKAYARGKTSREAKYMLLRSSGSLAAADNCKMPHSIGRSSAIPARGRPGALFRDHYSRKEL